MKKLKSNVKYQARKLHVHVTSINSNSRHLASKSKHWQLLLEHGNFLVLVKLLLVSVSVSVRRVCARVCVSCVCVSCVCVCGDGPAARLAWQVSAHFGGFGLYSARRFI